MHDPDLNEALLFDVVPGAYMLYRAFADKVLKTWPDAGYRVQKTQVTFTNPRVFACASLLRVGRKKDRPDPWITVTLGLPYRLDSPRASVCTEPYPGRWTVHILLGSPEEIDDELLFWIGEAYNFAAQKRRRGRRT